ncbi:MAG: hypothetical protein VKL39_15510, partial [Leptolyngbyaceae bacterium]|nr:hypothetical protein [Leptolyngbyaceae bacterium]
AVRLDSGDLIELSRQVRSLLPHTSIFASGDLDEAEIVRLRQNGAEIDGYGIGTKLVTGKPVNGVYKLVEIDGMPTMKASSGKVTYPGRKQIFRQFDSDGRVRGDRLGLHSEMATPSASESAPGSDENSPLHTAREAPLLKQVMKNGRRLTQPESLETIAQRTRQSVTSLPDQVREIHQPSEFSIEVTDALQKLTEQTRQRVMKHTRNRDG